MNEEAPALADIRLALVPYKLVTHKPVQSLEEAARIRGVKPSSVIKTMVVRRRADDFFFVLVPGDRMIAWPKLRELLEWPRLSLAVAEEALAVTGYPSGSITPFAEQLNYRDATIDAPEFITQQLGRQTTTGFRTLLSRDTRDYYLDPRTGLRTAVGFDLGTPYLGGSNDFYKYYFDVIKYTPLFFDTRFAVRGRYGVVEGRHGKPIPLTERFFVGGINTMRGFVFGRAGPVTPSGSLLGAAKELIFNFDFIFPISTEAKLNGVIFFDYGKGFDENEPVNFDLRSSAGLEVRWISPFGPLRAAYGINLDPNPNERKGVFEFTVGSLF